jgi:hypothetical protein
MTANNNVAAWLDTEISKLEQQLSAVKARLEAYREIRTRMPSGVANNGNASGNSSQGSRVDPNSIGSLAIGTLSEADSPLHVNELLTKLHAKGKPHLTKATLSSTLYTYVKAGKLRLTAPNTFALPMP